MAVLMIGYDLNKPETIDDYKRLIDAIKNLGSWWHCLDSTWLVVTDRSPSQVRTQLCALVDRNDELLVVKIVTDHSWASCGFNKECADWLQNNL